MISAVENQEENASQPLVLLAFFPPPPPPLNSPFPETEKKCDCQPGFYGGDCMAPRCSGVAKFTKPSVCCCCFRCCCCCWCCSPWYNIVFITDALPSSHTLPLPTTQQGNFTDHHQEGIMNYNSNALCQWVIYAPPPPPPCSLSSLIFPHSFILPFFFSFFF